MGEKIEDRFSLIVLQAILALRCSERMAIEFGCSEATVFRWASGFSAPLEGMKSEIVNWIKQEAKRPR